MGYNIPADHHGGLPVQAGQDVQSPPTDLIDVEIEHTQLVRDLAKPGSDVLSYLTADHVDLLHALVGMLTELGEIGDTIKKHVWYNQPLDVDNLIEEFGDEAFYEKLMGLTTGISRMEYLKGNISKLHKRYPKGYSNQAAKERADKAEEVAQEDTTGAWVIRNTEDWYLGRGDVWFSNATNPEIYTWQTAEAASSYLEKTTYVKGIVAYVQVPKLLVPKSLAPKPLTQDEINSLLTEPSAPRYFIALPFPNWSGEYWYISPMNYPPVKGSDKINITKHKEKAGKFTKVEVDTILNSTQLPNYSILEVETGNLMEYRGIVEPNR